MTAPAPSAAVRPQWRSWAPWNIPLARRLQTASILLALSALPLALSLIAALLLWPPLTRLYSREAFLLYVAWQVIFDRKTACQGGRPIKWVQRLPVWGYAAQYFPASLRSASGANPPYTPGKPHLYCLHPHGVISVAAISNFIFRQPLLGVDYRVATVSLPRLRDLR